MQVRTRSAPDADIDSAMQGTRLIVADDDVLLREGLASLLTSCGFDVIAQVGDGAELLTQARAQHPDVVVVDIRMPPTRTTEGLAAARVIRDELPDTAILVLSAHVEVEHAMELLASGQRIGYLLKSRSPRSPSSLTTCGELPTAARSSIPVWSRNWCRHVDVTIH